MAIASLQPYQTLTTISTTGLTSIVNALSLFSNPAPSDLVTAVCNYFQTVFYPSTGSLPADIKVQLQATAYAVINSYNNSISPRVAPLLTRAQSYFGDLSVGLPLITDISTNEVTTWKEDINDNITKADLSTDDQSALMLGGLCLNTFNTYWIAEIASPGSFWPNYFSSNTAENYANLKMWCAAAVTGNLIGYSTSPRGLITPTNDIVSVTIISALIGSFTIGLGKVMFGWEPRIQPISMYGNRIR